MLNWLRRAVLYRIYRRTIKQNSATDNKGVSKKLRTIARFYLIKLKSQISNYGQRRQKDKKR